MNTYIFPDDILGGKPAKPDEVIIRCYTSTQNPVKNRIVLNHNMINLLVSGQKTIVYHDATAVVNANDPQHRCHRHRTGER